MPGEEKRSSAGSAGPSGASARKSMYSARKSLAAGILAMQDLEKPQKPAEPSPSQQQKRPSAPPAPEVAKIKFKAVTEPPPSQPPSQTPSKPCVNCASFAVGADGVATSSKEMEAKVCNQTIVIPPELPDILKLYAKGAMRTQPPDLLRWSGAFFRAMANGDPLPMKEKVEFPLRESKDKLSPGILRLIDIQLGSKSGQKIDRALVLKRWRGFGMSVESFEAILEKAGVAKDAKVVEWDNVIAVMASTIGQNLPDTMAILCEVLTEQGEGAEPLVNYQMWKGLYTFVGTKVFKTVNEEKVKVVDGCLAPQAQKNGGLIGPKDFTSGACKLE